MAREHVLYCNQIFDCFREVRDIQARYGYGLPQVFCDIVVSDVTVVQHLIQGNKYREVTVVQVTQGEVLYGRQSLGGGELVLQVHPCPVSEG